MTSPANFMREDVVGACLAMVLFAPFLLGSGYAIGWMLDLVSFRRQERVWQIIWSIPLSVGVLPILTYLVGLYLSLSVVLGLCGVLAAVAVGIALTTKSPSSIWPRWVVIVPIVWALVILVSTVDLQWQGRLYPAAVIGDFDVRTAFVDSISRHGLPAVNPLYFPGKLMPLRYHYFWFIPCSLVEQLGGSLVGPRHALIASDAWCGWALMCMVALYLRYFHRGGERAIWKRSAWGIGLLAVTGLDVIPNLVGALGYWIGGSGWIYPSGEWWNNQIDGFPYSVLFVAHHVAALIACLIGFLLLWTAGTSLRSRSIAGIVAGLCFASGVGLSIYVTFAFAAFMAVWGVVTLVRRHREIVVPWAVAGITSVICALPHLRSLTSSGGSAEGAVVQGTIRGFRPLELVLDASGFSWGQITIANLIALPLNYFLEGGVWCLVVGLLMVRFCRKARGHREWAGVIMFLVPFLIATFLRSAVVSNNDLGWRSMLVAQFVVVVFAVDPIRAVFAFPAHGLTAPLRKWRFRVLALSILGLSSAVWDFAIMRTHFILSDAGLVPPAIWMTTDREVGRRTYAMRTLYDEVRRLTPPSAVVQANPNVWNDVYGGVYGLRQIVAFDRSCGAVMGGDSAKCGEMRKVLVPLFNDPSAARALDVDRVCDAWGVSVLVAKDVDPVWADRGSWVWRRPEMAAVDRTRAVRCGLGGGGRTGL